MIRSAPDAACASKHITGSPASTTPVAIGSIRAAAANYAAPQFDHPRTIAT